MLVLGMKDALESFAVAVSRFVLNVLYAVCCLLPRKDEAMFVSRQANEPSYDFLAIGGAFEDRGYSAIFLTLKLRKRNFIKYAFHAMREIYHLARCRICFVDRYDPVISLLDFKYERFSSSRSSTDGEYHEFPIEPVVVQLWHAFGAFKRFGFQSHDTVEGHTLKAMDRYRIHRNNSWVLCSGQDCRQAFSQAFNCPVERVVTLLRPVYDELRRLRIDLEENFEASSHIPSILFAPTLRKNSDSRHPFRDLDREGEWGRLASVARVEWAFHPLEEKGVAAGMASDALLGASIVVTDYSSIVYEAYLLGKPTVFYVPDIAEYRISPGLNIDPVVASPQIAFVEKEDLLKFLTVCVKGIEPYPWDALEAFVGSSIDECKGCALDELMEAAFGWLGRERRE